MVRTEPLRGDGDDVQFDRLLIAQAQLERLVVVTDDDAFAAFAAYDVETVW